MCRIPAQHVVEHTGHTAQKYARDQNERNVRPAHGDDICLDARQNRRRAAGWMDRVGEGHDEVGGRARDGRGHPVDTREEGIVLEAFADAHGDDGGERVAKDGVAGLRQRAADRVVVEHGAGAERSHERWGLPFGDARSVIVDATN